MLRKSWLPLTLLALVLGLALVFGCSDDDDPTDPGGGGNPGIEDAGSISGIVGQGNGISMNGVLVTTGAQTTTTNEDGYFVLTAVPEGSTLVGFAFDGFMSTFRVAEVVEGTGTHFPDVTMMPVESGTVDGAAGGEVSTSDGDGVVDFDAGSFVDGAGNPYNGEVTVELNAMLPDDDDFYGTFPGEFAGVREDGTEVPFVSYGFMGVQLMGAERRRSNWPTVHWPGSSSRSARRRRPPRRPPFPCGTSTRPTASGTKRVRPRSKATPTRPRWPTSPPGTGTSRSRISAASVATSSTTRAARLPARAC